MPQAVLATTSMIESIKDFVNVICEPHWFLIITVVALVVFLLGYRWFTKPAVAAVLAAMGTLVFIASCFDSDFAKIVAKADNVPIVMMLVVVGAMFWLIVLRPQRQEQKKRDALLTQVKKGDDVVTVGGIHGFVESVDLSTNIVKISVDSKTSLRINKSAITTIKDKKKGKGKDEAA